MGFDLLNGSSSQNEAEQRRQKQQRLNQGLQQAAQVEDPTADFVEQVLNSDLDPGTADMLVNLLVSDWVLGNLSDAEVHEARWLARTVADEVESMHPHEDSIWQGELRAYAANDESQKLNSLNSAELTTIFQLIQAFTVRVTRSEDMQQQEVFKKNINESRTVDEEQANGGWL